MAQSQSFTLPAVLVTGRPITKFEWDLPRFVYPGVKDFFGRSHEYEERLVMIRPDLCFQTGIVEVIEETLELFDRCCIVYGMVSTKLHTVS